MPHVLVVEDEPDVAAAALAVLRLEGFDAQLAVDGQKALNAMRKDRPGAVLLDLVLPVMDGWQLLAAMLADPELRLIPVVVTSALPEPNAPGARMVLTKPYALDRLVAALSRFVKPVSPPA